MSALVLIAVSIAGFAGCHEDCKAERNWCEGATLRICESEGGSELGSHDYVDSADCAKLGAVCMESEDRQSAACVLPDEPCVAGAESACSGDILRPCFEGFVRLDAGRHIQREVKCDHACMFSSSLSKSFCVDPDPTCVRAGEIECRTDSPGPGSSHPDFAVCVAPGFRALGECGLEVCGQPPDESDPCVPLETIRTNDQDAG